MKNIKFMALISPLILCGCSSTPEPTPTVTTYAVALQSGEGTFADGKTCIVLNNVVEGTPLNQIEGYKLPEEQDCIFSNWLDEQGNEVSSTIAVTSNLVLTASYEKDPEVIRKELSQKIEEEGQKADDYATDKQIKYGYTELLFANEKGVLPVAKKMINDSKNVTSPTQMQMIYEFTHLCIETMNKIDVVGRQGMTVDPYSAYNYIAEIYFSSIENYTNKNLTVDQLTVIHNLSCTMMLSYWQDEGAYQMYNVYDQYTKKVENAISALELREIDKIGCGLIRGCSQQSDEFFDYQIAEKKVSDKLKDAKKILTTEEQLKTIIDCLGSAASIYCKYGQGAQERTTFDLMYDDVLAFLINESGDSRASDKLKILLAFIEADGYYIDNGVIENEYTNLLPHLYFRIEVSEEDYINGITEIAKHGADALKQYNEHCTNYNSFIATIKTVVDVYTDDCGKNFLDCAIHAMDMGAQLNLVPEDLYFKEYKPTISPSTSGYEFSLYNDYAKIDEPLQQAIDLFKNAITNNFPEKKLEALKIVTNGIITTSKLTVLPNAKNTPTPVVNFIAAFTEGEGLEIITKSSVSAATGFAYACAGLNYAFSYLYMMTTFDTYAGFNNNIQANIKKIFENWAMVLSVASYNDYLAKFIGQAIGLSWQEDCTRIAQMLDATGDRARAIENIFAHAEIWLNHITDCLHYVDSQETIYSMKDVIISTLSSDRFYYYHLCGTEDTPDADFWQSCIAVSDKKENDYLKELLPLIYSSTTIEQFVTRANIYVTEFIDEINKQNHAGSFKDLNSIFNTAKQDMEAVK